MGIRSFLKTNVTAHIRNPSFEISFEAMKTEAHIVRFMFYPTSEIRLFVKCDDEIYNTLYNFYHSPVVTFMGEIARDKIKILLGVSIKFYITHQLLCDEG